MLHTEELLLKPVSNKIFHYKQNSTFCYVNRPCVSLFADLSSLSLSLSLFYFPHIDQITRLSYKINKEI
jgi:hypothetical protein